MTQQVRESEAVKRSSKKTRVKLYGNKYLQVQDFRERKKDSRYSRRSLVQSSKNLCWGCVYMTWVIDEAPPITAVSIG